MLRRIVDGVELVALVAVAVFVVMLFTNEPDRPAAAPAPGPAEPTVGVDGAAVYAASCSSCHGDDGTGGFAPELGGARVVTAFPDVADQIEVVTSGSGGMPAFRDRLTAEEIAAVVDFTRTGLGRETRPVGRPRTTATRGPAPLGTGPPRAGAHL
jgi:mono/diheme cytochrome c family protein